MGITPTGIWTQDTADEAHIFSYNVARWIGEYLPVKTVHDFGCGKGTYCDYLDSFGFDCIGYEGFQLDNFEHDNIVIQDLTQPFRVKEKGHVICLEVWEHIPAEFEDKLINNIVNALDGKLIMSVAILGQSGTGHVNCRNNDYIIKKLEAKGLKFLPMDTINIRIVPEGFVSYFRNTLMIFEKLP